MRQLSSGSKRSLANGDTPAPKHSRCGVRTLNVAEALGKRMTDARRMSSTSFEDAETEGDREMMQTAEDDLNFDAVSGGGVVKANALLGAAIYEVFEKMYPSPLTREVDIHDAKQGFMEVTGHVLNDAEAAKLMEEVDVDRSGTFDYGEFAAWMMTSSALATELRHKVSTVAVGRLDNLVNDAELAFGERQLGHSIYVWISPHENELIRQMQTLWVLLEEPGTSRLAFWVNSYMQVLIIMGTVTFICETMESANTSASNLLYLAGLEWFCILNFTIEYLARVVACPYRPDDVKPQPPKQVVRDAFDGDEKARTFVAGWGERWHFQHYITQPMNVVDVVAIAPAYIEMVASFFGSEATGGGLAVLRVLRLARILRMIKIGSYKENLDIVLDALIRSKTAVVLMVYLVVIFCVVMAAILFIFEGDPKVEDSSSDVFVSIPQTFWCVIVTMSSVGYGDMYPTSDLGRFVTSIIMVSGILTLAVPITLIGNRFNQCWVESRAKIKKHATVTMMKKEGIANGAKKLEGSETPTTPTTPDKSSQGMKFANPIDENEADEGEGESEGGAGAKLSRQLTSDHIMIAERLSKSGFASGGSSNYDQHDSQYKRRVKTTIMVAKTVLKDCELLTGDPRFVAALGYLDEVEQDMQAQKATD